MRRGRAPCVSCPAGRNVSCLEWNPENQDLLATGYGEFDFARQSSNGLILFWSLKNPEAADKVIKTPCGVTAIAFSAAHPNLLAAGLCASAPAQTSWGAPPAPRPAGAHPATCPF